jgi:hypothetical protein
MTPTEMCVLFCGDILAFLLIWFTNIAERESGGTAATPHAKTHHTLPQAPREKQGEDHHHLEVSWNVGAFFGLKNA